MHEDTPDDDRTLAPSPRRLGVAPARQTLGGLHGNALPEGTRLGEFELKRVLGEGGFSIVYLAWDHTLHRNVALKEYIPAEMAVRDGGLHVTVRSERHRGAFDAGMKSFVNEARLLASFNHPSLVKVHRFWEDRGTAFMVMPWYQGPTLKAVLSQSARPPDEAWLLKLLGPLTQALQVLHAENCFHRDIAPDNVILLGDEQTPLLLDFGAARRVIEDMTQDLTVILKRGFAPLEQYGEVPGMRQGPWTDIYALGAVVHFALLGTAPPPAVGRILGDIDGYKPLSGRTDLRCSERFLKAVDGALSVRPEHRPQSVQAFRCELGLEQLAPSSVELANGPSPRSEPLRHATLKATIVIAGSAAVAGALWWRSAASPASSIEVPPPLPTVAAAPAAPAATLALAPAPEPMPIQVFTSPPASGVEAKQSELVRRERGERRTLQLIATDLQALGRAEKRDVSAAMRGLRAHENRAEVALREGNVEQAIAIDRQGRAAGVLAMNALVDELLAGYGKVVEQATHANELEIAQQALDRARVIRAMRR